MNIKEAKTEISNTLKAYHEKVSRGHYIFPLVRQRPVLLMGPPGIGKTAIMEQVAEECGVGLVSYTITHHTRQSAIGLPSIKNRNYQGQSVSVTEYTLSEIIASVYECMERTGKKEGILFIDEINCVSETLAPTMLQFLQNKTFGSHKVPEGWLIVAAGNPPEYNKSVREFDIVTLDRVRKIEIEVDCDVWMEYAWRQQIHGAVLSYLNTKKDNFYQVENTVDGKFFVTARGWEDLSEILKSYERFEIPVTEKLVIQYLQKEEIARDFAVYYQLYCKYGTDYAVPEIAAGTLTEEAYIRRGDMARQAAFEERFTVTGLFLDYLNQSLHNYNRIDRKITVLYEALKDFKVILEGIPDMQEGGLKVQEGRLEVRECRRDVCEGAQIMQKDGQDMQVLRIFIEDRRNELEQKILAEQISEKEAEELEWAAGRLDVYDVWLKENHIRDREKGMDCIKEFFGQDVKKRQEALNEVSGELERAFHFLADCFGEEQEMVLFVSGLSKSERAMEFISNNGCDMYFKYSEALLFRKKEEELKRACIDLV